MMRPRLTHIARMIGACIAIWMTLPLSGGAVSADPPLVMMRFSSAQTRSLAEWKGTAKAFAANRGCCDDVWFSTGESFPSLGWHSNHVVCVREAAEDLRRLGFSVSLQFEATIGHGDDFPTAEEKRIFDKPWTGWTGHDGTECVYCSCPRQPAFLKRLTEVSELYAIIRPSVVWIDDDLRITNHNPVGGKDAPGCWCARCVADFSEEDGYAWTRASLFEASRRDAVLRKRWHDYSARSLAQVACTIARAFRKVSPTTRMGLQTGVDRKDFTPIVVRALARETGEKVGVRVGSGYYWDIAPYNMLLKSALTTGHRRELALEDVVDSWCTEVESYPRAYGSRSVRSMALESFAALAWGFNTTSMFVMDRRSETDATYARYLLGPMIEVTAFLNGYRTACRDTQPAGFTCPELRANDTRRLLGLPILTSIGVSWCEISAEHSVAVNRPVWGDFRPDRMTGFEVTPSCRVQEIRDRLSSGAPLEVLSPFVGLVLPRVTSGGVLRTIGLVGARLDTQTDISLRLDTSATTVVWHELGEADRELPVVREGNFRQVTIPRIGAWNLGYLELKNEK